jgi:hypothetical protein
MYQSQRMTTFQDGEIMYNEFCTSYDPQSIHIDSLWKTARIASVIGFTVSGFLLLWQFSAPFLLFDTNYWRIAMILYAFLAIMQGCTFLFLHSTACTDNALIYILAYNPKLYPSECSWDSGTRKNIASTILYAVTVLSMCIIPAPGTRPKERPYPMMVWDNATITKSGDDMSDCEVDDDDDNDSVTSFADDGDDIYADTDMNQSHQTTSARKELQDV